MFKTEYIEVKGDVTPKVAELYFKSLGYKVDPNYVSSIRHGKTFNLNKEDITIFNKYETGFPDYILEKDNSIEFIKYRYNKGINYDQLRVLKELSVNNKVRLIFFVRETLNVGINFKEDLELTYERGRSKGFKPLWVAAELYKKLGFELYDKENMTALSNKIRISEDKIRFFLSKTVDGQEIKKVIKKLPV